MRALLAFALVVGAGGATLGDIPPWLYAIGSIVGSGVFLRYYTAKAQKQLAQATAHTQQAVAREAAVKATAAMENLQERVLDRAQRDYARMETRAAQVETKLAEAETDRARMRVELEVAKRSLAEKETKISIMARHIESLHDQIAALRQGMDPAKRRLDDA